MEMPLKNQVAVVTGASGGIGSGIAKSLAAGTTVIVKHPSERSAEEAKAILIWIRLQML